MARITAGSVAATRIALGCCRPTRSLVTSAALTSLPRSLGLGEGSESRGVAGLAGHARRRRQPMLLRGIPAWRSWARPPPCAEATSSCLPFSGRSVRACSSSKPAPGGRSDAQQLRLFKEFRQTLQKPEDIWVWTVEARRKFALEKGDLDGLTRITKESPYEAGDAPFVQVPLREVVELALKKHGEDVLLQHFWSKYMRLDENPTPASLYGSIIKAVEKPFWYNAPSTTTVAGRKSILQGLQTNVAICFIKGGVWISTGSHVMFADFMHSIADVGNYSYRLFELSRSSKRRDFAHPYGYAPLRYITADRSFVFLLFVGGVMPLGAGIREFFSAHVPVCDHIPAVALVFLVSAALEGKAVRTAYREILSQAANERVLSVSAWRWELDRVRAYLYHGRDVMSTATFTEASSGVVGAGIGLVGLAASWWLQSGVPDVIGSIVMASMVCGVSTFLLRKSGGALLGQTLPQWRVEILVSILQAHPSVAGVYDVKTEMVGTDTVRFKAEVQFMPQAITARMLQTGLRVAELDSISDPTLKPPDSQTAKHAEDYRLLAKRLQHELLDISAMARAAELPEASKRVDVVSPWLYRNSDLFYEALVWELKDAERALRDDLRDFNNVHIDLEPW